MFEHKCIICNKIFEDDNEFAEECFDCQEELAEENGIIGEREDD